ncbi:hypothetical protein JCM16358_08330 [Halanaerocella petrolearia]
MPKNSRDKLTMYLAIIFIGLACFNVIDLLSLDRIIVFSFALGSLFFALSNFFNKHREKFIFVGVFCIIGLHLLKNEKIILQIRELLGEETILLLTIGLSFLNLYFSDLKKEVLDNKLKIEYEKGKKDVINELEESIKK